MVVRLPRDIEALVTARVSSGEFASPEEVVRTAMAPWIERELRRARALEEIRGKVAAGDADDTEFGADEVADHLDEVAAEMAKRSPDAA